MRTSGFLRYVVLAAMFGLMVFGVACGGDGSSTQATTSSSSKSSTSAADVLSVPDIVEKLRPSVVQVQTEGASLDIFGQAVPQSGVGTGFIIDKDGRIVTNNHVVRLSNGSLAQKVTVALSDNRTFTAQIVGTDALTDLAVIKIDANGLTPVKLGDASALRVGETVVAIGHALALEGGPTVSTGVVSAKGRTLEESERVTLTGLLQTDAAINPGNSGGPVANLEGEVIGISTARIPGEGVEGIGFAISIDNAKPIVDELIANGKIDRGFLGIGIVNITPGIAASNNLPVQSGVGLTSVSPNSGAARAGLQAGDIIVKVGDKEIKNSGDLTQALTEHRAGDQITIEYYRGSAKQTTTVTLGSSS